MIRGLYLAASGMVVAQERTDIVADNLANVNTSGYKKDIGVSTTFNRELLARIEAGKQKSAFADVNVLGSSPQGVALAQIATVHSPGSLKQTQVPTDLAIEGQGYFQVSTPNGIRYTRNGSFLLDESGALVTTDGFRVMGANGPISGLRPNDFRVNGDGSIEAAGKQIDKLMVADFAPGALRKVGNSLFQANSPAVGVQDPSVRQGYLEQSNVDLAQEMVEMMTALRSYQANQRVIQTSDSTMEKAVNEIARL